MKELKEISNSKIIVDTNVLVYCGTEDLGDNFQKILRNLVDSGNELAISAISVYEILKKFHNKEDVIDYYEKLLAFIKSIEVDRELLEFAGRYANCLFEPTKNDFRRDNDCIIAATAFKNKALILTSNRKDFPLPYWKVIAREHINWEDKKKEQIMVQNVFLLEASNDAIDGKMKKDQE